MKKSVFRQKYYGDEEVVVVGKVEEVKEQPKEEPKEEKKKATKKKGK